MSANKEETLRQFCDVTGTDEARSRFFLESSNWQLEVALSSFYEHGGNADEVVTGQSTAAAPLPTLSDSDMESPSASPPKTSQKKDKKKPTASNFATLDSLHQDSSSDDEDESRCGWIKNRVMAYAQEFFCDKPSCSQKIMQSSQLRDTTPQQSRDIITKDTSSQSANETDVKSIAEEIERLRSEVERLLCENRELREELARLKENDEGQAFYAGGSERSGQQILGPGKGRKDIVTEMFKSVRERGAVVFDDEPSSTSRGRSGVFSGVGYRLGQTADDHEPVTPSNTQAQGNSRLVRLCLYREGFSVDGGALRLYTDPENAEFLSCVRRSEIPPELAGLGGEVRVSLQDRRHEECPRNIAKAPAFIGKGHMLGSPTPPTVGATAPVASAAPDRAANQRAAQDAVGLDPAQPTTSVQFRLADGSRLTGRFNHSHTVRDLSAYVSRAEPLYQLRPFALLTTFPSAELADPAATLAGANLLNSTVLQRLK